MEFSKDILRYEEQVIFKLRSLYKDFGYTPYRMSRFEEYELYAANKAFLPSGEILTFTGAGGKLMALRPDVTLSIVKYTKDDTGLVKLYYNENIYRSDDIDFKEQMQVGLECIGEVDVNLAGEVLLLAKLSLETLNRNYRLDISHMGFLAGLIKSEIMTSAQEKEIINCVSEKNTSELKVLCKCYDFSSEFIEKVVLLSTIYGNYKDIESDLRKININEDTDAALRELDELYKILSGLGIDQGINIDFSVVNDISYYNGIIFQGYIDGTPSRVLSGGRYDELLRKFGKKSNAIGFAVYLDNINICNNENKKAGILNIALPKGRLGEKAYAMFEAAGYGCPEIHEESRRLVFENPDAGVRYFWVKPSDVAKYVERGAADIGVAGKDILLEYTPEVYELLDLNIGKCSICVAAEIGFTPADDEKTLRVATKFPNIARKYYQKQGREIDIIQLNGSIELAPLLGLSDVIVDIIETGKTLRENKMAPVESIVDISARLISNKTSYKFNKMKIDELNEKIAEIKVAQSAERHGH